MDSKNWLILIGFFLILFFSVLELVLCIDRQFEACLPRNCGGAGSPNISYPFWIHGSQNATCGFPGFELYCNNTEPILRISGQQYVIKKIVYANQSLLVTKLGAQQSDICYPATYKLNLYRSPFTFVPGSVNISIFFNCSVFPPEPYLPYSLNCSTENDKRRSLALYSDDPFLNQLNQLNQSGGCENSVSAPVDRIRNERIDASGNGVVNFSNVGFNLKWNASRCDECADSGGRCGFDFTMYKFMCFCPDRPHQRSCGNRNRRNIRMKVGIGVGTGFGGILLTCIVFILYQLRKRKISSSSSNLISRGISDGSIQADSEKGSIYFQTPKFTYKELDEATNHFDSSKELGDGGYGTVYHGKLRDGRVVAIKRLFEHNYKRVEQFINEIAILSQLRHQNLVSLYGCTSQHSRELLLVYEYIPNGTVADHLHGDRADSGLLTWPIRMSIAIESADAVAYLHASGIIHRDIKTTNILLDKNFHVKVADFGLSRLFPTDVTHVSTAPQGTPGYVDPEYYQCYQLNDKSDVYSFGVVLIELISSQTAVDIGRHRHEINLANLAINRIHSQALHELVDPSLGFDSDYDIRVMITLVAELAFRCLQQDRETRPSMVEVLDILKGIESEEYKKKKKNNIPVSPDSVTDAWISTSSTPNTSAN